MQNEFANRQNMHLTVLKLLDTPEYQPVWKNQKPAAFTTLAETIRPAIQSLSDLISVQQAATTGYAAAKEREEKELETTAHEISQALAAWFDENGREGDSAQIDISLSAWQRLRDTELIAKARLLHQKLTAALASDAASLAEHDLSADDATLLAKETADFENITADPSAAISRRRSNTLALRPKFREVSLLLQKMDRLVLRFRRTEPGTAFASAWKASRIVRDSGGSASGAPEPVSPAT